MIISDMRSDFLGPMLHGIEDIASQAGFDLLISTSRRTVRGGNYPVGPNNTDGLLIFSDGMDDETLVRFSEIGFPMILIHRKPPSDLNVPSVNVENTTSSQMIVEHLILEHHRRKIVLLRGPESQSDSYERELGYRAALETNNLPYDPMLVHPGEFDRAVAQASIQDLLQREVDFDAVFCGDDEAAIGVLAALQEAGKKVPQEVAVIGFDDQNMSAFLHPALTTVRAPTIDVGRIAAEKLIELIHTGKTEPAITLPTEIILRRSCGCR
jgi:DNA-binding LacI/PurR family transcriptional regulator